MAWQDVKRLLGRKGESPSQIPKVNWIEAANNPWRVRVLDVRPVTLTILSTSTSHQCAANAVQVHRGCQLTRAGGGRADACRGR